MLLDIGAGIIAALVVHLIFNVPLTALFITSGVLFALLPDVDYILHIIKGGGSKNAHTHRDLFHHPLIFIPIGTLVFWWYNPLYAVLFALCSFLHFFHDSIGLGWGVQWLSPLNDRHYSFFYLYQPRDRQEKLPQRKLLYSWDHKDIEILTKKFGDEEWIKNIYFKLHPFAVIELLIFVLALILLTYSLQ
jgi:hypothetical protein